MESFLANRSHAPEGADTDFDYSSLSLGDESGFGANGFAGDHGASGGFVSLFDVYGVGRSGAKVGDSSVLLDASGADGAHGEVSSSVIHHAGETSLAPVEPQVEVVTVNGRIEKIIVTCSGPCRVELDCTY
jgi:hypothetical protein